MTTAPDSTSPRRKVFLVHGRNTLARDALHEFLIALDLRVINWTAASNSARTALSKSPTTLEIVEAGMRMADAVVVLFTPDDFAQLHPALLSDSDDAEERKASGQARQNVILEAGMALGLDASKVQFVRLGKIRRMSDIDGINFVNLNDTRNQRNDLRGRLGEGGLGLAVDHSDARWVDAGNFDAAVETVRGGAPF